MLLVSGVARMQANLGKLGENIVSTQKILQRLEQQVEALAKEIEPIASTPARQARFDVALFSTHGTRLRDYLAEVRKNLAHLILVVDERRPEQVAFLAEKLVAQITALQRELATQTLRTTDQSRLDTTPQDLYHKLAEHQQFERRLIAMIEDRESSLGQQSTFAQQKKIQQELAALEGRLMRCRQALKRIERNIERKENGF
jgi:primosomal replication protein N''